jgi:chemotaxis protein methyltransferase CheR
VTPVAHDGGLSRFRAALAAHLGLHFEEARSNELSDVFGRLCAGSEGGAAGYLARLESASPPRAVLHALVRQLTVGETYFFRNPEQLRAFAEIVLPERLAARSTSVDPTRRGGEPPRVRILSAGCASGEEPYSLAIIVREAGATDGEVAITAVDVNPTALERAAEGRYSSWSLRETPAEVRQRWFREIGRDCAVVSSIRAAVHFEERNLAALEADLWLPERYDVIFCRNVLMYLTAEAARTVVMRAKLSLVPGGYLFLGHADSLRDLSEEFVLRNTHGAFYYQRAAADLAQPSQARTPAHADPGWTDGIRESAERVQALVASTVAPQPAVSGRASEIAESFELLARERFAEALDLLDRLPGQEGIDPDVVLLRAVLLTHRGRLDAAETACHELCAHGSDSAGARYLLALCRERAGDLAAAVEHDRMAACLDPAFAMPRLHLGLLARRAGDLQAARRELTRALDLLAGEDAARILLFGGGFTRDALSQLCRAELHAAGYTL